MANEKKITKIQISVLMEWEDFIKAKRKFGKEGETRSELMKRIIHDLVKDVKLTLDEIKFLEEIYNKQLEERTKKRAMK